MGVLAELLIYSYGGTKISDYVSFISNCCDKWEGQLSTKGFGLEDLWEPGYLGRVFAVY